VILLGIGIGTGINIGNVVDLANLDLVDFDILSPDGGSRLQPDPNPEPNLITQPDPEPDSIEIIFVCLFFSSRIFFRDQLTLTLSNFWGRDPLQLVQGFILVRGTTRLV
jgi:hypothetical protein